MRRLTLELQMARCAALAHPADDRAAAPPNEPAAPRRAACAWYVAGSDAADWLQEISRWEVPHASLIILPLPRSRRDRAARGALIVPPGGDDVRGVSQRCLPFTMLAGRLYLPADAELAPEVEERELRAMLDQQYQYVWHPQSGLVAFADGDIRRAAELLAGGPAQPRTWNFAQPGIAVAGRLLSLAADVELTVEQIMRQAADGIGDEQPSLDKLPPSASEPADDFWSNTRRRASETFANVVKHVTDRLPSRGGGPSWIDRWRDWAGQQLDRISADLEAARNRELLRLMDLLGSDPDRGLRYALPLTGDAHRGAASPGARLTRRDVNFSLAHLGGGGPADFWDVPPDYVWKLHTRYRELAGREINLGRHRRAAYIYAELLGDYEAAAGALMAGRHWREAAVVYRDRLKRPMDAARCLEQGSLWSEAVELYDELAEHEKAGDLLMRLEQRDEASIRYERALGRLRGADDHLSAARLLEDKLEAPHEALAQLARGWPDSPQSAACLRGVFQLAGRLGEHDESHRWVSDLRDASLGGRHLTVVEILTEVARDYPDRSLRDEAAEGTRAIVSRELPRSSHAEAQSLVSSVARLVPEDRLLGRDCHRYLDLDSGSRAPLKPRPLPRTRTPRKIGTLRPSQTAKWKQFTTSGNTIYAAGVRDDHVVLARCDWNGNCELSRHNVPSFPLFNLLIFAMAPHGESHILLHGIGQPLVQPAVAFHREPPLPPLCAGAVAGMPLATIAASRSSPDRTWLLHELDNTLLLECISTGGQTISSIPVKPCAALEEWNILRLPVVHARTSRTYVGYDSSLLVYQSGGHQERFELNGRVIHLAGTDPFALGRVVATLEHGGAVFWERMGEFERASFGEHSLENAVAGFNRRGLLIAVCPEGGEIYGTGNYRLTLEATMPRFEREPLAVLSAPHVRQFGIALDDGTIDVYEMP